MKVDLAHIFDVSKQRINSFLISTNPNIFVMFNEDEGVVELERDGETILSGKIPMSVSVKASRSKKRKV
ncbi:MAG: hypothetical protein JKY53_00305 [Flavobacteriales bacterium]|nr:hypothetical protein [Flavobacteriales bacterium]